jgi:hypothetical protein
MRVRCLVFVYSDRVKMFIEVVKEVEHKAGIMRCLLGR